VAATAYVTTLTAFGTALAGRSAADGASEELRGVPLMALSRVAAEDAHVAPARGLAVFRRSARNPSAV
jgi:hypothetical protein